MMDSTGNVNPYTNGLSSIEHGDYEIPTFGGHLGHEMNVPTLAANFYEHNAVRGHALSDIRRLAAAADGTTADMGQQDGDSMAYLIFLNVCGFGFIFSYLTADAFTSQFQQKVFKTYDCNTGDMIWGMNLCSLMISVGGLIFYESMREVIAFLYRHPSINWHIFIFSLSGAVGQYFIFYTIKRFGALTFTIITTIRQMLAVVLSSVIYFHPLGTWEVLGLAIVFGVLLWKPLSKRAKWMDLSREGFAGVIAYACLFFQRIASSAFTMRSPPFSQFKEYRKV